jgi:hypothetical protein
LAAIGHTHDIIISLHLDFVALARNIAIRRTPERGRFAVPARIFAREFCIINSNW